MPISLSIHELPSPNLQFGGSAVHSDPKVGLELAGPYDLRFGGARKNEVRVGVIGPQQTLDNGLRWLERTQSPIPTINIEKTFLHRSFPGFSEVFRAKLVTNDLWKIVLDGSEANLLQTALDNPDPFKRFAETLSVFSSALRRLSERETARPDVVLICLSDEILSRVSIVSRDLTQNERKQAKAIQKRMSRSQLDLFDLEAEITQTADDLLSRDFRTALKAEAMRLRMPIQIGTDKLFVDSPSGQDAATRAWNSTVALYYKAGGVPWRLQDTGPETCYVGISFHHYRTVQKSVVRSSLAQAFSSEGEGFALRGDSVPWERAQGRNLHLTGEQAESLANRVIDEYRSRTGGSPLRVVIHKTSTFNADEQQGFLGALENIPTVELVTLIPSNVRLVKFGQYPPTYGTYCRINDHRQYLFTSGYMPELDTYPGPHIPQPFEIRHWGSDESIRVAQDVLGLTRMNWNTADIRGKWPVTLSFARRVGGILDEFGEEAPPVSSFRYFL